MKTVVLAAVLAMMAAAAQAKVLPTVFSTAPDTPGATISTSGGGGGGGSFTAPLKPLPRAGGTVRRVDGPISPPPCSTGTSGCVR